MGKTQTQLEFPVRRLRSAVKHEHKENVDSGKKSRGRPSATPTRNKVRSQQISSPVAVKKSPLKPSNPSVLQSPQKLTPKKKQLLQENVSNLSPVASPTKNPSPVKKTASVKKQLLFQQNVSAYSKARQSLNLAIPDEIIGREKEIQKIRDFVDANVNRQSARAKRSLYISGAPGTGKTASLMYILGKIESSKEVQPVFINCMALKNSDAVFTDIAQKLSTKCQTAKDPAKFVEQFIVDSKKPILLILDEIDQLDSKNEEILYKIFEWPFLRNSKLFLIGIANSLDLTDRILPRLKLRKAVCPDQLSFPSYRPAEIEKVLLSRLAGSAEVIKPVAIKYLAKKIATMSGDMRKALDICRRAIELAEIDARRQTVLSPKNSVVRQVDIPQVLKIVNRVYGSQVTASLQESSSALPLQQKLLLASLLLLTKHKTKEVTAGYLVQTYSKVCKKRMMAVAGETECLGLCSLLETRGLINMKKVKDGSARNAKVSLRIDEQEVSDVLQDKTLLSTILNDISCLS